jgi:surface carbohydrate biosynthesis protein
MFIKLIKLLFNTKFIFLPPKKSHLMLYDGQSEKIVSSIFKLKYFIFLKTRKEEINLFILLKTFLKFQFTFFDYIINYIDYCECKVIITSIDNDPTFYKIKSRLNVTTVFFQNGIRMGHGDIFSILDNKKKFNYYKSIYYVDLMCVFNEMTGKIYQKFIRGKTLIAGSVLSNKTKLSKNRKKNLIYISSYRQNMKKDLEKNFIKLIIILKEYCEKKNLKLNILSKYFKNSIRVNNEKDFYYKILKKNFSLILNSRNRKTYNIIDNSKITVSGGSTLGIESLGRKNKTLLINPSYNIFPYRKNFFGYFTKRNNLGVAWYNGLNQKIIINAINRILKIKEKHWIKITKKLSVETSLYDYNNKIIKKELTSLLKSKKLNTNLYLK